MKDCELEESDEFPYSLQCRTHPQAMIHCDSTGDSLTCEKSYDYFRYGCRCGHSEGITSRLDGIARLLYREIGGIDD